MLGTPSRDYWIPYSEIYPTVSLMWMISWSSAVTWILMWISLSSSFPLSSTKTHHQFTQVWICCEQNRVHVLSASGCSPLTKHTAAISEFPPPSDKPALQRFKVLLISTGTYSGGAARIPAPLTNALKGPGKRSFFGKKYKNHEVYKKMFEGRFLLFWPWP